VQQHLLRFSILNQKEVGVKLNKGVIIKSKAMNGNQIFVCGWDMKDMIKNKITIGVGIIVLPMRLMSIPDPFAA